MNPKIVLSLCFLVTGALCNQQLMAAAAPDPRNPIQSKVLPCHIGSYVDSVAFSPDGTNLATGSSGDGTVCIWNVGTGAFLHSLADRAGGVYSVTFSPDGTKFATGSGDGIVCISNAETGALLYSLTGHTGGLDQ